MFLGKQPARNTLIAAVLSLLQLFGFSEAANGANE
jgi:hypothetical protein